MKVLKKVTVMALVLMLIAGLFPARSAQAATKPAKAKVTAKANDDGTSVTLTIAKTKKAQGYQIMVKKPGAKKFTKLTTISEDGTAKRTYTAKKLTEGEYQFKVRAYLKNGKKTVWGKYSKVAKVKVESKAAEDTGKDDKDTGKDPSAGSSFAKAKTGDIITFGAYEQDNDTKNGKEPIEWIVLSNDGKELFVMSKYALDCQPFNTGNGNTWEECYLRKWLNEDFYNSAFSASDKKQIKTTNVKNSDNPTYGTKGGNDTTDNVFLLSLEDVSNPEYGFESEYSALDIARRCAATAYAKEIGAWSMENVYSFEEWWPYANADKEPNCIWWLRSPGKTQYDAADVIIGGKVKPEGAVINYDVVAVRPAIVIDLSK